MGDQDHDFGSQMPPKLDKNSDSGRIIIIASEDLLGRVDEWRAGQRPIPNKSEAGRALLELGLRAGSHPGRIDPVQALTEIGKLLDGLDYTDGEDAVEAKLHKIKGLVRKGLGN